MASRANEPDPRDALLAEAESENAALRAELAALRAAASAIPAAPTTETVQVRALNHLLHKGSHVPRGAVFDLEKHRLRSFGANVEPYNKG